MQRPFFSLSKNKRVKPIDYLSPDKSVRVHISANREYGMATIWDADILIYLASHFNELRESGRNDLSPTVRVKPSVILDLVRWGVGGKAYKRLIGALDRLQTTTIKTNIRSDSKMRESVFSFIDSYTHLVCERTGKSLGMEITASKWMFEAMMDKRAILSISPDYFEISSGIGRWMYRVARKHAGGNGAKGFDIGIDTLYHKSGSESPFARFKAMLLHIVRQNDLPDVHLELIEEGVSVPRVLMVMRKDYEGTRSKRLEQPGPSEAPPDVALQSPVPAPPLPRPLPVGRSVAIPASNGVNKSVSAAAYVDPSELAKLREVINLRSPEADEGSQDAEAPSPPVTSQKRAASVEEPYKAPQLCAQDVLPERTHSDLRANFPRWDLDMLLERFLEQRQAEPAEIPDLAKRFYGFVQAHDARNRW